MTWSARTNSRTALVLGGGGSTGNAWLIGVIAGLFEAGVDVTGADLIIGTSAGSTAAAQITSSRPPELFAGTLLPPPQRSAPIGQPPRGGPPNSEAANRPASANALDATAAVIAASADAGDMRRRMGAWALATEAASPRSEQWRSIVGARLPVQEWPAARLLITAVDADTGAPVVFDRDSGVAMVDAVAASCAGGFAYRIGDRHFIDGGYRTNADNADLASGYGTVLVLSPFGGRSRLPAAWGMHLARQVDELRTRGSFVETVFPDAVHEHLFGGNAMDLSQRPAAARAGHDQAGELAERLAEFWPR